MCHCSSWNESLDHDVGLGRSYLILYLVLYSYDSFNESNITIFEIKMVYLNIRSVHMYIIQK